MKRILLILGAFIIVSNLAFLAIYLAWQQEDAPFTTDPSHTVLPPETDNPDPDAKSPIKDPPEQTPQFVAVEKVRSASEASVYGDVMSHSHEAPFGNAHGRATNVHETNHGINSWLRNKHRINNQVNGFYVLQDRGVILEEPQFRKSQVAKFVPQNLRADRFSMYITGQTAWDDTPTYILDEWVCYLNGAKCNVEDVQMGRYQGSWTDGVSGSLEFSIYSIALAMAVKEYEPTYWEQNPHFRSFVIWMLRESHETFMVGRTMDKFKWDKQDKLLQEFLTASSAEPMRKFVQENLDGVWLDADVTALKAVHYEPYQQSPVSQEVYDGLKRSN